MSRDCLPVSREHVEVHQRGIDWATVAARNYANSQDFFSDSTEVKNGCVMSLTSNNEIGRREIPMETRY